MKAMLKTATGLALVAALAACGGGGGGSSDAAAPATIINKDNYVEVAGLSVVAANRFTFLIGLADATFQTVIDTNDVPGTYPCLHGGTMAYTKNGQDYFFNATECDTSIGGQRVLIQSGSMTVRDAVVQTTVLGYFLTYADVTFENATVLEAGAPTVFTGDLAIRSEVINDISASVQGTGRFNVLRAGRTDSYTGVKVALTSELGSGNQIEAASLNLESPRAPDTLVMSASETDEGVTTLEAAARDGSKTTIKTTQDGTYLISFVPGPEFSTGLEGSNPLASAIAQALQ